MHRPWKSIYMLIIFIFFYCWTPRRAAWDEMVGDEWPQLHGDIASRKLQRFLAPLSPDGCNRQGWWVFSSRLPIPECVGMLSLASSQDVQIKKEADNSSFSCFFNHFSNPWSYSLMLPGDAPNAL